MSIPSETVHSQNNRTCDEHHTAKAFEWQKLDVVMKVIVMLLCVLVQCILTMSIASA